MLRNKSTTILSDLQDFFNVSEKATGSLMNVINTLSIPKNLFRDKENNLYSSKQKLLLLLLFPFFGVKDCSHFRESAISRFIHCGKDVFYRYLNLSTTDWRKILYHLNMKLLKKVEQQKDSIEVHPRCLIVDDTDMPKTGRSMELIGRVFSHVTQRSILALKGLFLGYHDGKSFYGLDFSLHGEKGKNAERPYGLSQAEFRSRYSKTRPPESAGGKRVEEYFQTKIASTLSMIRRAIEKGIRFDYLLVDSWFTCYEIVRFIHTRRIGCHLLGMQKMGNTRYHYQGKMMTSKEIAADLRRKKQIKRSRRLNCWYGEAIVHFQDMRVKLFFCKSSGKGSWNAMLSTNLKLGFEKAYQIYATRWTIEVYFKEAKQYLGLGKNQSQDFDAQIAHTSLCILQYNMLSAVKRFTDYETIGELFRQAQQGTLELTVYERIWQIIIEIIHELSEMTGADMELLMENLFSENEKFSKLINYQILLKAS